MSSRESSLTTWRVVGRSVQGATHRRRDLPNQDALCWLPDAGVGSTVVLAVADGHGSRQSPRSQDGARFAVTAAVHELHDLVESAVDAIQTVCDLAPVDLPNVFVDKWRRAVREDVDKTPFSSETSDDSELRGRVCMADPFLAYGTTLLVAAVTPTDLLLWQLGDGDILLVTDDGKVSRPVQGDVRLVANETTSLCG